MASRKVRVARDAIDRDYTPVADDRFAMNVRVQTPLRGRVVSMKGQEGTLAIAIVVLVVAITALIILLCVLSPSGGKG